MTGTGIARSLRTPYAMPGTDRTYPPTRALQALYGCYDGPGRHVIRRSSTLRFLHLPTTPLRRVRYLPTPPPTPYALYLLPPPTQSNIYSSSNHLPLCIGSAPGMPPPTSCSVWPYAPATPYLVRSSACGGISAESWRY
eukprot:3940624-Rhodomonas_salina.4